MDFDLVDVLPVGSKFRQTYIDLPDNLLDLDEEELVQQVKPTENMWALRKRFWAEFRLMTIDGNPKPLRFRQIREEVVSERYFTKISNQHSKVAFITRPLLDYDISIDITSEIGYNRIKTMISQMPTTRKNKQGEDVLDLQKARFLFDLVKWTTDRAKGQAIQRQQIAQNITTGNQEESIKISNINDPAMIEAAIAKQKKSTSDGLLEEVIDV
jgi:hypothetical protein